MNVFLATRLVIDTAFPQLCEHPCVTIRKTLLLAFLFVGLGPAILLAYLAFVKASHAIQSEIELGLSTQASTIAVDIDKVIFERLQNAATWSRLEVMQDLQVKDVDKRLSNFLARSQQGYSGIYRALYAVDAKGRVVASSNPASIGQSIPPRPTWQQTDLSGGLMTLELPEASPIPGTDVLTIRTPISSAFGNGSLGQLLLNFDWTQIDSLLDKSAGGERMVALLDTNGRLVAASHRLQLILPQLDRTLASWGKATHDSSILVKASPPLPATEMLVGVGQSVGFAEFHGFGWRTLVIMPRNEALKPVHHMALIFLAILSGIAFITVFAAFWVSREIAKPIVALTAFSRRYMLDGVLTKAPPAAGIEVTELRDTFVQMVQNIDLSRQNLVRAAKLAAVGEMSAVIAHEVRTPLGILRSSAQMLQREPSLSKEGREMMGFIESETERINRLVSTMLDSARPRPPHFAATDMHELIRRSVALLAAQALKQGVSLTIRFEAHDPRAECDAEQMTQVLLNLFLNGLQILGHGGQIVVTTKDAGNWFAIEIADDGPGIAPENRKRVFEAFFFLREGGIGLGLAVVQQIIVAHGGQIEATESELGGALFQIRFPRNLSGHDT